MSTWRNTMSFGGWKASSRPALPTIWQASPMTKSRTISPRFGSNGNEQIDIKGLRALPCSGVDYRCGPEHHVERKADVTRREGRLARGRARGFEAAAGAQAERRPGRPGGW